MPRLRDASSLALFALLSLVITWPLPLGLTDRLVSWGDPVFQLWTMAWDIHAWRTDPSHVFDANIFYPYPNTLAYADHLFGQAAIIAPVLLATGNAILATNLSALLALTLSGFFMYLLVFDLTGNRLAAVVAGIAYAYAPARMAHLEHLNLLSAQWLPLGALTARRALLANSSRWAAVLGLVVVLEGLFSIYYLFFLALLLGVLVGTYLLWNRRRDSLIAAAKVAVACAVALLILLPTLLPYQRVQRELGIERTVEEVIQWQAVPGDYLAVHPNNWLYGDVLGTRFHRSLEQDLFPGVILLLLALIGLANRRFGWERWMLLLLVAGSVVLSFGVSAQIAGHSAPLPYRLFYDYVPGFRAIRVPARLGGLLALVGLAALAGLGLDALATWARRWRASGRIALVAAPALALLAGAAMIAEDATQWPRPDPLPTSLAQAGRLDYAWMAQHPAPALELPMGEGIIATAWPNFWSTMHWNPVVNGYSAFPPPAYYPFRDFMHEFPSPGTIKLLQGIGVETVVYHEEPGVPRERDPVLTRAADFPQLTLVVEAPPDYVFRLDPDPWLWDLARAVPDGQAVDLPMIASDSLTFGMLAAILQRLDHEVYGNGAVTYWQPRAAPPGTCYAVLPSEASPDAAGYRGAVPVTKAGSLTLYRSAECGP